MCQATELCLPVSAIRLVLISGAIRTTILNVCVCINSRYVMRRTEDRDIEVLQVEVLQIISSLGGHRHGATSQAARPCDSGSCDHAGSGMCYR